MNTTMEKWSTYMNGYFRKKEIQMTNIQMEKSNIKEVQSKIMLSRIYYQSSWPVILNDKLQAIKYIEKGLPHASLSISIGTIVLEDNLTIYITNFRKYSYLFTQGRNLSQENK